MQYMTRIGLVVLGLSSAIVAHADHYHGRATIGFMGPEIEGSMTGVKLDGEKGKGFKDHVDTPMVSLDLMDGKGDLGLTYEGFKLNDTVANSNNHLELSAQTLSGYVTLYDTNGFRIRNGLGVSFVDYELEAAGQLVEVKNWTALARADASYRYLWKTNIEIEFGLRGLISLYTDKRYDEAKAYITYRTHGDGDGLPVDIEIGYSTASFFDGDSIENSTDVIDMDFESPYIKFGVYF